MKCDRNSLFASSKFERNLLKAKKDVVGKKKNGDKKVRKRFVRKWKGVVVEIILEIIAYHTTSHTFLLLRH